MEPSDGAVLRTTCPPLVKYDKQTLLRVANELELLPANAEIPGLLQDYGRLRDICRKITNKLK